MNARRTRQQSRLKSRELSSFADASAAFVVVANSLQSRDESQHRGTFARCPYRRHMNLVSPTMRYIVICCSGAELKLHVLYDHGGQFTPNFVFPSPKHRLLKPLGD